MTNDVDDQLNLLALNHNNHVEAGGFQEAAVKIIKASDDQVDATFAQVDIDASQFGKARTMQHLDMLQVKGDFLIIVSDVFKHQCAQTFASKDRLSRYRDFTLTLIARDLHDISDCALLEPTAKEFLVTGVITYG